MDSLDKMIEETYAGFGTSGHLDLDDLRLLYYGRRGLYVSFTDNGDYEIEGLARPDCIVAYDVRDVVGRKVNSNEFYANVFRIGGSSHMTDIRKYTSDQFQTDLTIIQRQYGDPSKFRELVWDVVNDVRIRSPFERLWRVLARVSNQSEDSGMEWRRLIMRLGYNSVSDPVGTGLLNTSRSPVTLVFNYQSKMDLDILPIQKHRRDPRLHVRERVSRKVDRMGVRRNRIARRTA